MNVCKAHQAMRKIALAFLFFLLNIGFMGAMAGQDFRALKNGVEVSSGAETVRVVALRDDVVRVRMWRGGEIPEDASWAVLAEARAGAAPTTAVKSAEFAGFETAKLRVLIRRSDLRLTVMDRAGNVLQEDARAVEMRGTEFRIAKVMPAEEHYFGLGDKAGPLDRRGQAFTLWNTDAYQWQESTDPLYKSIPFYMSFCKGRALGVLLDNTWRSQFDFGKAKANTLEFGAANGPLDYYVIYGPTPKEVLGGSRWLTGATPLPPMWALGYQQSRYSYMTEARVLEVAAKLRADRIPADAIYLDIDYQVKNRPFTVDRESFPDFAGMLKKLHGEGFHVVAITDLHIAKVDAGYAPYESGTAGDHFVRKEDGTVFWGKVWPGPSVFPDFTRQQTRDWWGGLYGEFERAGLDGYWNDMNEPAVFESPTTTMSEDVQHRIEEPGFAKRTASHAEIHNVYGMENSRATYEGLLKIEPDVRPFVLTRASFAGGQRYAVTWTGDNSSTWNHLRMTTPMLENLGLSGFALSGADVGGYAGTPTAELLTRWMEIAAFQPIDRDHTEKGSGDQEPWVGGAEQEAIRRRYIEERYRLMAYLYTTAEEMTRTGVPMLRALFVEFPDAAVDRHPLDVDRDIAPEFLMGPELLIAPQPYGEKTDAYAVTLPTEGWYDYWTGQRVARMAKAGLPTVMVTPELARLPVYVRPGAIVPMAPLVQSTEERPVGPLTLRVYAGGDCRGSLYQDDGKSFGYRRGEYLREEFGCEVKDGGLRVRIGAREGKYAAWWKTVRVEVYGWSGAGRVMVDGKPTASEKTEQGLAVTVADEGKGTELVWQ